MLVKNKVEIGNHICVDILSTYVQVVQRITLSCFHFLLIDAIKRADWTPLMLACTKTGLEAFKCIEILSNNGADTTLKNKVLLNNSNITEEKNKHQFIF